MFSKLNVSLTVIIPLNTLSTNILIFPDIDSGNIGYKLVERFGNYKAYGPIAQGLKYPVNDLSRGSSVEDIEGVIVITALQATKNMI